MSGRGGRRHGSIAAGYLLRQVERGDWLSCLQALHGCAEVGQDFTSLPFDAVLPFLASHGKWETVLRVQSSLLPARMISSVTHAGDGAVSGTTTQVDHSSRGPLQSKAISPDASQLASDVSVRPKRRLGSLRSSGGTDAAKSGASVSSSSASSPSALPSPPTLQATDAKLVSLLLEVATSADAVASGGGASSVIGLVRLAAQHELALKAATVLKCRRVLSAWIAKPSAYPCLCTGMGEADSVNRDIVEGMKMAMDLVNADIDHRALPLVPSEGSNGHTYTVASPSPSPARPPAVVSTSVTQLTDVLTRLSEALMVSSRHSSTSVSVTAATQRREREAQRRANAVSDRAHELQLTADGVVSSGADLRAVASLLPSASEITAASGDCVGATRVDAVEATCRALLHSQSRVHRKAGGETAEDSVASEIRLVALQLACVDRMQERSLPLLPLSLPSSLGTIGYDAVRLGALQQLSRAVVLLCGSGGRHVIRGGALAGGEEGLKEELLPEAVGHAPYMPEKITLLYRVFRLLWSTVRRCFFDVSEQQLQSTAGLSHSNVRLRASGDTDALANSPEWKESVAAVALLLDCISEGATLNEAEAALHTLVAPLSSASEEHCAAGAQPAFVLQALNHSHKMPQLLCHREKQRGGSETHSHQLPSSHASAAPTLAQVIVYISSVAALPSPAASHTRVTEHESGVYDAERRSLTDSSSMQLLATDDMADECTLRSAWPSHLTSMVPRFVTECLQSMKDSEVAAVLRDLIAMSSTIAGTKGLRLLVRLLPPPTAAALLLSLIAALPSQFSQERGRQRAPSHTAYDAAGAVLVAAAQNAELGLTVERRAALVRTFLDGHQTGDRWQAALRLFAESPTAYRAQHEAARVLASVVATDMSTATTITTSSSGGSDLFAASHSAVDQLLWALVVDSTPPRWEEALAVITQAASPTSLLSPPRQRLLRLQGGIRGIGGADVEDEGTALLSIRSDKGYPLTPEERAALHAELEPLRRNQASRQGIAVFYRLERSGKRLSLDDVQHFAVFVKRGPLAFAERLLHYVKGCESTVLGAAAVICAARYCQREAAKLSHEEAKSKSGSRTVTRRGKHQRGDAVSSGRGRVGQQLALTRHRAQALALRGLQLMRASSTSLTAAATSASMTATQYHQIVSAVAVICGERAGSPAVRQLLCVGGVYDWGPALHARENLEHTVQLCRTTDDTDTALQAYRQFREEWLQAPVKSEVLVQLLELECMRLFNEHDATTERARAEGAADLSSTGAGAVYEEKDNDVVTEWHSSSTPVRRRTGATAHTKRAKSAKRTATLEMILRDGLAFAANAQSLQVPADYPSETELPAGGSAAAAEATSMAQPLYAFVSASLSALFGCTRHIGAPLHAARADAVPVLVNERPVSDAVLDDASQLLYICVQAARQCFLATQVSASGSGDAKTAVVPVAFVKLYIAVLQALMVRLSERHAGAPVWLHHAHLSAPLAAESTPPKIAHQYQRIIRNVDELLRRSSVSRCASQVYLAAWLQTLQMLTVDVCSLHAPPLLPLLAQPGDGGLQNRLLVLMIRDTTDDRLHDLHQRLSNCAGGSPELIDALPLFVRCWSPRESSIALHVAAVEVAVAAVEEVASYAWEQKLHDFCVISQLIQSFSALTEQAKAMLATVPQDTLRPAAAGAVRHITYRVNRAVSALAGHVLAWWQGVSEVERGSVTVKELFNCADTRRRVLWLLVQLTRWSNASGDDGLTVSLEGPSSDTSTTYGWRLQRMIEQCERDMQAGAASGHEPMGVQEKYTSSLLRGGLSHANITDWLSTGAHGDTPLSRLLVMESLPLLKKSCSASVLQSVSLDLLPMLLVTRPHPITTAKSANSAQTDAEDGEGGSMEAVHKAGNVITALRLILPEFACLRDPSLPGGSGDASREEDGVVKAADYLPPAHLLSSEDGNGEGLLAAVTAARGALTETHASLQMEATIYDTATYAFIMAVQQRLLHDGSGSVPACAQEKQVRVFIQQLSCIVPQRVDLGLAVVQHCPMTPLQISPSAEGTCAPSALAERVNLVVNSFGPWPSAEMLVELIIGAVTRYVLWGDKVTRREAEEMFLDALQLLSVTTAAQFPWDDVLGAVPPSLCSALLPPPARLHWIESTCTSVAARQVMLQMRMPGNHSQLLRMRGCSPALRSRVAEIAMPRLSRSAVAELLPLEGCSGVSVIALLDEIAYRAATEEKPISQLTMSVSALTQCVLQSDVVSAAPSQRRKQRKRGGLSEVAGSATMATITTERTATVLVFPNAQFTTAALWQLMCATAPRRARAPSPQEKKVAPIAQDDEAEKGLARACAMLRIPVDATATPTRGGRAPCSEGDSAVVTRVRNFLSGHGALTAVQYVATLLWRPHTATESPCRFTDTEEQLLWRVVCAPDAAVLIALVAASDGAHQIGAAALPHVWNVSLARALEVGVHMTSIRQAPADVVRQMYRNLSLAGLQVVGRALDKQGDGDVESLQMVRRDMLGYLVATCAEEMVEGESSKLTATGSQAEVIASCCEALAAHVLACVTASPAMDLKTVMYVSNAVECLRSHTSSDGGQHEPIDPSTGSWVLSALKCACGAGALWSWSLWPPLVCEQLSMSDALARADAGCAALHIRHPLSVCAAMHMLANSDKSSHAVLVHDVRRAASGRGGHGALRDGLVQAADACREFVETGVCSLLVNVTRSSGPVRPPRCNTEARRVAMPAGAAPVLDRLMQLISECKQQTPPHSPRYSALVGVVRFVMDETFPAVSATTAGLYEGYVPASWYHVLPLLTARVSAFEHRKTGISEHTDCVLRRVEDATLAEQYLRGRFAPAVPHAVPLLHGLQGRGRGKGNVQALLLHFLRTHSQAVTIVNPIGWHAERQAVVNASWTSLVELLALLESVRRHDDGGAGGAAESTNLWSPGLLQEFVSMYTITGAAAYVHDRSAEGSDAAAILHRCEDSPPTSSASPSGRKQRQLTAAGLHAFFTGSWRRQYRQSIQATVQEHLTALRAKPMGKGPGRGGRDLLQLLRRSLREHGTVPSHHLFSELLGTALRRRVVGDTTEVRATEWAAWGLDVYRCLGPYMHIHAETLDKVLLLLFVLIGGDDASAEITSSAETLRFVLCHTQWVAPTAVTVLTLASLYEVLSSRLPAAAGRSPRGTELSEMVLWRTVTDARRLTETELMTAMDSAKDASVWGAVELGCRQLLAHGTHRQAAYDDAYIWLGKRLATVARPPYRGSAFVRDVLGELLKFPHTRIGGMMSARDGRVALQRRAVRLFNDFCNDHCAGVSMTRSGEVSTSGELLVLMAAFLDCDPASSASLSVGSQEGRTSAQVAISGGAAALAPVLTWERSFELLSPHLPPHRPANSSDSSDGAEAEKRRRLVRTVSGQVLHQLCRASPAGQWPAAVALCEALDTVPPSDDSVGAKNSHTALREPRSASCRYMGLQYLLSSCDVLGIPVPILMRQLHALSSLTRAEMGDGGTAIAPTPTQAANRLRVVTHFSGRLAAHPHMPMSAAVTAAEELRDMQDTLTRACQIAGHRADAAATLYEPWGYFCADYIGHLSRRGLYADVLRFAVATSHTPNAKTQPLITSACAMVAPTAIPRVLRLLVPPSSPQSRTGKSMKALEVLLSEQAVHIAAAHAQTLDDLLINGHSIDAALLCVRHPSLLASTRVEQTCRSILARHHPSTVFTFFSCLHSHTGKPEHPPISGEQPAAAAEAAAEWRSLHNLSPTLLLYAVESATGAANSLSGVTTSEEDDGVGAAIALTAELLRAVVDVTRERRGGPGAARESEPQIPQGEASGQMRRHRRSQQSAAAILDRSLDAISAALLWIARVELNLSSSADTPLLASVWVNVPWSSLKRLQPLLTIVEEDLLVELATPRTSGAEEVAPSSLSLYSPLYLPLIRILARAKPTLAVQLSELAIAALRISSATANSSSTSMETQLLQLSKVCTAYVAADADFSARVQGSGVDATRWRDDRMFRISAPWPDTIATLLRSESAAAAIDSDERAAVTLPLHGFHTAHLARLTEALSASGSVALFVSGVRYVLAVKCSDATFGALAFTLAEASGVLLEGLTKCVRASWAEVQSLLHDSWTEARMCNQLAIEVHALLTLESPGAATTHGSASTAPKVATTAAAPIMSSMAPSLSRQLAVNMLALLCVCPGMQWNLWVPASSPSSSPGVRMTERLLVFASLEEAGAMVLRDFWRPVHDGAGLVTEPASVPAVEKERLRTALYGSLKYSYDLLSLTLAEVRPHHHAAASANEGEERGGGETAIPSVCMGLVDDLWRGGLALTIRVQETCPRDSGVVWEALPALLLRSACLPTAADPCGAMSCIVSQLREHLFLPLTEEMKALVKVESIKARRTEWRAAYVAITGYSPSVAHRRAVLSADDEAAERRRLSETLRATTNYDRAWRLSTVKRARGVRLEWGHYTRVLQCLVATHSGTAVQRWSAVEQWLLALLRDGLTPTTQSIDTVVRYLAPSSTDAKTRREASMTVMYLSKVLTALPPLTNTAHRTGGKGRRAAGSNEKSAALTTDVVLRAEEKRYSLSSLLMESSIEACLLVVQSGDGGDNAEAQEAVALLTDFIAWCCGFSRMPAIRPALLDACVQLLCRSERAKGTGGPHQRGYHTAQSLIAEALTVTQSDGTLVFQDRRAEFTDQRPPEGGSRASLGLVSKQLFLWGQLPSPTALLTMVAAVTSRDQTASTLQRVARIVQRDEVSVRQRATLTIATAEQSLWGRLDAAKKRIVFTAAASRRPPSYFHEDQHHREEPAAAEEVEATAALRRAIIQCVDDAYASVAASFAPPSARSYEEIIFGMAGGEAGAPITTTSVGSVYGRAMNLNGRSVNEDVDDDDDDLCDLIAALSGPAHGVSLSNQRTDNTHAGSSSSASTTTTVDEQLATLRLIVHNVEAGTDLQLPYRTLMTALLRAHCWEVAAPWIEAGTVLSGNAASDSPLAVSWVDRQQLLVSGVGAEASAIPVARVAEHATADDLLLLRLHRELVRVGVSGDSGAGHPQKRRAAERVRVALEGVVTMRAERASQREADVLLTHVSVAAEMADLSEVANGGDGA